MTLPEVNVQQSIQNPAHLTLEAGCTLREAIDMQFNLLAAECDGQKVIVDGSHVERIDTAGLQLLVAFVQRQAKAGRSMEWAGMSDMLVRSSRRLGVDELLGILPNPVSEAEQT